ncbi:MAG: hypothetical protein HYX78_00170 [Armatimonadetes bacterium]|nr:hypothetical protein [Armatimonadota bacterium]
MDYLDRVERQLDLPPAEKEQVMLELRSHYEEIKEELVSSGMNQASAEEEAARRMGPPDEIAARMQKAHLVAGWKTTLLAIIPLLLSLLLLTMMRSSPKPMVIGGLIALISVSVLMLAISSFELRRGKRPVWVATWLAAGLVWPKAFAPHDPIITRNMQLNYVDVAPDIWFWRFTLLIALATAIAIWAGGRSYKWTAVTAVIAAVGIGSALHYHSNPMTHSLALAAFSSWAAIMLIVALRLFSRDSRSMPGQASLFLFAAGWVGYGQFHGPANLIYRQPVAYTLYLCIASALAALTVLLYSRSATWQTKYLSITYGIIAQAALAVRFNLRTDYLGEIYGIGVHTSILLILVVMVPLLWERGFQSFPRIRFVVER